MGWQAQYTIEQEREKKGKLTFLRLLSELPCLDCMISTQCTARLMPERRMIERREGQNGGQDMNRRTIDWL